MTHPLTPEAAQKIREALDYWHFLANTPELKYYFQDKAGTWGDPFECLSRSQEALTLLNASTGETETSTKGAPPCQKK